MRLLFWSHFPVRSMKAGIVPVTTPWTAHTAPVYLVRASCLRPSTRKNSSQRKAQLSQMTPKAVSCKRPKLSPEKNQCANNNECTKEAAAGGVQIECQIQSDIQVREAEQI